MQNCITLIYIFFSIYGDLNKFVLLSINVRACESKRQNFKVLFLENSFIYISAFVIVSI